jgi:hypothetical protein
MNPMDSHADAVGLHRRELERAAAEYRRACACRAEHAGPSPLLRLYARVWWASRPRVGAWGPPPATRSGLTA